MTREEVLERIANNDFDFSNTNDAEPELSNFEEEKNERNY